MWTYYGIIIEQKSSLWFLILVNLHYSHNIDEYTWCCHTFNVINHIRIHHILQSKATFQKICNIKENGKNVVQKMFKKRLTCIFYNKVLKEMRSPPITKLSKKPSCCTYSQALDKTQVLEALVCNL